MNVYCVMSGEERIDLDHVVYASTNKADAEIFACKNEFYNYNGNPHIEILDVEKSEDKE